VLTGPICTGTPAYAAQSDRYVASLTTAVHPIPSVPRESILSSLEHYLSLFLQLIIMINSAQLNGIALVVGVGINSRTWQTRVTLTDTTSQGEESERKLRFLSRRREPKLSSSQI
jgi:hypothetical protein